MDEKYIWWNKLSNEEVKQVIITQLVNPFCRREIVWKKSIHFYLGNKKNVYLHKKHKIRLIEKFFKLFNIGNNVKIINLDKENKTFQKNWLKFYMLFKEFSVGYFYIDFKNNVIFVSTEQDKVLIDFLSPILQRKA
jgi:sulfur relay (sulfurtransferase) DsrC/TusE family protein